MGNNTNSAGKSYLFPLVIVGIMFFVMGFGVGISGILTPFLKGAFTLTTGQSYLVTAAIFSAFLLFGTPAGWLIKKIGYKYSMIISFFIMALGMVLFVPSANLRSFPFFLLALFVGGIGNTLLQASVNPYITILGPTESAAMRMSLMGIMNKAAWWLGPVFLAIFLDISNAQLQDVVFPFYLVTGILVALGLFVFFVPLPEVKAEGEDDDSDAAYSGYAANKTSIFQFPHLLLGVLALFFYVGVETLPMASIIDYAKMVFPGSADIAGFAKWVPIGMVVGYLFGVIAIPKYVSQGKALIGFTLLGIIASLLIVLLPGKYSIYCLAFLGLANSLMWPAIWPLAISDLGKFTKTGASLLVMAIVGGAIIPLIFGFLVDAFKGANEVYTVANYRNAYWILLPGYLIILYFALKGHKIRK